MLEEIKNIKAGKKELKNFGITIGVIFLIIGIFYLIYQNEIYQILFYVSGIFIFFGLFISGLLKPIYVIWMVFAVIIGWVMTRLILSILFYFVITPIGLFSKIIGKDFLSLKRKNEYSYWNNRDSKIELSQDYEKQY